ncbi:MAG: transcriptional repressor [Verrucomicrobiota bacterium]
MKTAAERESWALQVCQAAQMRVTPLRAKVISLLAEQRVPVSLESLTQADRLGEVCNTTTVYRTLMLLQGLAVLRQVSLPDKAAYFVLNIPGESSHFLVCQCCGTFCELPVPEPFAAYEAEIAATKHYTRLRHDLIYYGICPACQQHPPGVVCAKLQPSMRRLGLFKSATNAADQTIGKQTPPANPTASQDRVVEHPAAGSV